jgi:hypothetical protein
MDRLPWLPDEPVRTGLPRKRRGAGREFAAWIIVAVLLVAVVSYWFGAHGPRQPVERSAPTRSTMPLPQPRIPKAQQAQPEVALEPQPQVIPAPMREVPIARPHVDRVHASSQNKGDEPRASTEATTTSAVVEQVAAQEVKLSAPPAEKPLTAWPATQSEGARGRIVRVGAFGTREQAKIGWNYMVRAYPAVAHLKATVVGERNSRGRHFYRFQIGTTSQAHSEVLCQRMEKIDLSCAVVGLPWKPKGVER